MRTTALKFRCPLPLDAILQARVEELGYKDKTAYLVGLLRYDLLTRKPHSATSGISNLKRNEQDRIDDEIARMFDTGETLNGSWFEHKIREAAEAVAKEDLPVNKIVDALLARIKENKP